MDKNINRVRRGRGSGKSYSIILIIVFLGFGSPSVCGQALHQLRLPELDAANSLNELADQSRHSILYSSQDLEGVVLKSLEGFYSLPDALDVLLRDTGLNAVVTDNEVIVISIAPVVDETQLSNEENSMQSKNTFSVGLLALLGAIFGGAESVVAQEGSSGIQLEEILVTAQKRQESIQDIPAAVTSMSGSDLSTAGVDSLLDMQSLAPGLQVSTAAGTARVFIRGIGLTNFAMGGEPSVAFHTDGAVISRPSAQISTFYDLERIEILRGPQGSLYGRNATGGSINVLTRRPEEQFGGYAKITAGNYDSIDAEGALGGSIVEDTLLGRVAFRSENRAGFGTNIFNGGELDDADSKSMRLGLSYIGSDSFDAFLSLSRFETDAAGDYHMLGPANPAITPNELAMGGLISPNIRDSNSEVPIGGDKEIDSATLELSWQLTDDIELKSLSNYFNFTRNVRTDLNGTPVQFYRNDQFEHSKHFSEELQLSWEGENHSTMFGLYYFQEDIESEIRVQGPVIYSTVFNRPFIRFAGEQSSESYAAFWNTTWHLGDQWSVTGGLRFSEDSKEDMGSTTTPPGAIIPIVREATWDDWTPKLTLEYTLREDLLFYASASDGYKAGVMNIGNAGPVVDPESILSFEVGVKSQWNDKRLQFNAALFNATIENLQVQRPINGNLITVNAAEAETKGIELETVALLTDRLTLTFNAAYIKGEFSEFLTENTTFAPGVQISLAGNPLPNTPEFQGDITLRYETDYRGWSVDSRVQAIFTDERWFNEFQEDIAYQDATTTLNANMQIRFPSDQWSLNFWGRNLSNEEIISHINVTSSAIGHMRAATIMEPRTFGATIEYEF